MTRQQLKLERGCISGKSHKVAYRAHDMEKFNNKTSNNIENTEVCFEAPNKNKYINTNNSDTESNQIVSDQIDDEMRA